MKIPEAGLSKKRVLADLKKMAVDDVDWSNGRSWSLVYHVDDAHKKFVADAHNVFASANLLNPLAFKSLKQMESDVVNMSADLFNGDSDVVGTMTSGGTESILLAVKAARERARRKVWIRYPEIVAPASIHVAFDKAAHYFGLKLRRVPLADDFRVDMDALKKSVGRNTVLIAASAPQYAHGVVDPIEEIGAFAQKKSLPFHVDACFGGFTLPWFERLGEPIPPFDFRVDGVTSMSADIHKFGYAAKGASVILYRDMDYLKHQFFVATEWPGGIYASPTVLGTRPGGPIGAAWATLQQLGVSGYLELTQITIDAKKQLRSRVENIDGLRILGSVHGPIVTYASDDPGVDLFAVADQMQQRGWAADRQQDPPSVHCTVTANHKDHVDAYADDLAECVEHVRANPQLAREGEAAMYGMMAKIPVKGAVKYSVGKVMEQMYSGGEQPDLSDLSGSDDSAVFKLMDKYGDKFMDVLDKLPKKK